MSEQEMHIILTTPRPTMRQFTEGDVDNLFNLDSDPEVMRFLGRPASRDVLRDKIIPFLGVYQRFDRLGHWAAESARDGKFWAGSSSGPVLEATSPTLSWAIGCAGPPGIMDTPPRDPGP